MAAPSIASESTLLEDLSSDSSSRMISDVLLALAKDNRYLESCQRLLRQILSPSSSDPSFVVVVNDATASLIARLLYTCLVLSRKSKSIGDESLRLEYRREDTWKLVGGSVVAAVGLYIMRRLTARGDDDNENEANNIISDDEVSGRRRTNIHDNLRGDQRRAIFEDQRRQMLSRGSRRIVDVVENNERQKPAEVDRLVALPPSLSRQVALRRQARRLVKQLAVALSPAFSVTDGPHSIVFDETSRTSSTTHAAALGSWLARMHLAWYLLDGQYPTLMHRLLRFQYQQPTNKLRRPTTNNTVRIVGLLLLTQAVGTLVPALGKRVIQWWLLDRKPSRSNTPCAATIAFVSSPKDAVAARRIPANKSSTQYLSTTTSTCVICRQPRTHPACSVKCGHLMCWTCLQQWVQKWKSCPICRVSCQPQDILALQGYGG
jgi:hypothetical protein